MKIISKITFCTLITIASSTNTATSQTDKFTRNGIKLQFGAAVIRVDKQIRGMGRVLSAGYERSFGAKNNSRINTNLLLGGFSTSYGPLGILAQTQAIVMLNINYSHTLFRYNSFSAFCSAGLFTSALYYEEFDEQSTYGAEDSKFIEPAGYNIHFGLRLGKKDQRTVLQIIPINYYSANKQFQMVSTDIILKIKLGKKVSTLN